MQVCASDGARSRPQLPAADETAGMPEEGSTSFGWQSMKFKDLQEEHVEDQQAQKKQYSKSISTAGRANAPAPCHQQEDEEEREEQVHVGAAGQTRLRRTQAPGQPWRPQTTPSGGVVGGGGQNCLGAKLLKGFA